MLKRFFIIAGILPLFFISCDPAAVILIHVTSGPGNSFKAYVDKNFGWKYSEKKNEQTLISLSSDMPKRDTMLFFGIGTWPEERVKELVMKTDSIVIVTPNEKKVYKEPCDILKFYMSRRKGMMEQRIEINVGK